MILNCILSEDTSIAANRMSVNLLCIVTGNELKMLLLLHTDLSLKEDSERLLPQSSFFKLVDVPVSIHTWYCGDWKRVNEG